MSKLKKVGLIIGGFLVVFSILGFTTIILETSLLEMPNLLVHMRAKEFCSCHFTLGNEKDYCLKKVKYGYPDGSHTYDEAKKEVTFSFAGSEARAYVRNEKLGCNLVE